MATVTPDPEAAAAATAAAAAGVGWQTDGKGRQYVPRPGGQRGMVYRQGEETVLEAIERDHQAQANRDSRPRKKSKAKRPEMPPAPTRVDLKELEKLLAEAFKSPAMICATFGDEWAANHFTDKGPYLARNLIVASEHNPWLRAKLEQMALGGDAAMALITMLGVGGALALYIVPPTIYFLNLPVGQRTRAMFDIPDRPAHAPAPPPPPGPPPAPGAQAYPA